MKRCGNSIFPIPVTEVQYADSSNLDAFGGLRVSSPFGVSDNKNISSKNRNQMEAPISGAIITYTGLTGTFSASEEIRGTLPAGYIAIGTINTDNGSSSMNIDCNHNDFVIGDTITGQTSGATATIATVNTGSNVEYDYDRSSVILSTGAGTSDSAIRHNHKYNAYIPGKSHKILSTFVMGTTDNISILLRTSTSGSVSDARKIPQSDWNIDGMDSSVNPKNPSGLTIDFTKTQILSIDLQWLGVGRVRICFDIDGISYPAHEFLNANSLDVVYMKTPTLPAWFEVTNSGTNTIKRVGYGDALNGIFLESTEATSGSDQQLEEICHSVISEGGYSLPGTELTTPILWANQKTVSTRTPLVALRLKSAFPAGEPNRRIVKYLDIGAFVRTNDCIIEICHIHDPIDITATWTDIGNGSACEYSTDISSITGRPEHIVDASIVAAGGGIGQGAEAVVSSDFINLHGFISQNTDSTNSQVFVVYGTARTGSSDVTAHITFVEFE